MELNKVYQGDCLEILRTLPSESVDCIVTSPPYWALRDYGVEGQLGLESTFQEYVIKLCDIFDDVKRVLKKQGTCWVNIGDTYGRNGQTKAVNKSATQKSLCQIPSRFAIEMCNRGWILRNEIIWHKPNAMPSSVKDRFTVDFEKVFFFVKSKKYSFEQQIEPYTEPMNRWGGDILEAKGKSEWDDGTEQETYRNRNMRPNPEGRNKRCVWSINTKPLKEAHFATFPEKLIEPMIKAGCPKGGVVIDPFMGACTTAVVAEKLGRRWVGIELNGDYIKICDTRLSNVQLSIR